MPRPSQHPQRDGETAISDPAQEDRKRRAERQAWERGTIRVVVVELYHDRKKAVAFTHA